jgi:serine protease Do
VLQVQSGSAADRAGIRPGDVITKVGDQTVQELARLDPAIAAAPSPISITTLRRGTARQILADLEQPPPPEPGQAAGADAAAGMLRDQLLQLQEEVKQLRAEVQKLRGELERAKSQ